MSKNLSDIQTNIGYIVGDTSSAFATKITTWVNNRYRDIIKRYNWNELITLVTIPTVSGQANYSLGFNPINCMTVYIDDYSPLDQMTLREWIEKYSTDPDETGRPIKYIPIGNNQIKLHYVPDGVYNINLWEKMSESLSNASDVPKVACEDAIELGVSADAWRAKRQFQKATDMEVLYNLEVERLILSRESAPDKISQFTPIVYDRNAGI